MTTKITKLSLYLILVASSVMLSGCGQRSYAKRHYILDVAGAAETAATSNDAVLDIRTFTIDSAFDSKGLVYRKSQFEYEVDFYNEFLISPALMVTEKTRNWLSQSGLFATVLDAASYTKPTHTLRGNITALYGDLRDRSSRLGVMEMRVFLVSKEAEDPSTILAKTYRVSSQLKTQNAEGLVAAFDNCLEEILTDLQRDLEEEL
ncbi:MAG: ABC-type transport auxiliary lipoprotein family protein [Planctomycetota bacterium]